MTKSPYEPTPVSHSVAHHLVAIAELLDEYGYARVSDVARRVRITRGSASITLKSLKQKGLVTEDDRRFLGLSEEGAAIAGSVKAKKAVMKDLFVTLLGVAPEQADEDTCRIEHVVSAETAESAAKLLEFLDSKKKSVGPFLRELQEFQGLGGGRK